MGARSPTMGVLAAWRPLLLLTRFHVAAEGVFEPDAGRAGGNFGVQEVEARAGEARLGVGEGGRGAAPVVEELPLHAVTLLGAGELASARLDGEVGLADSLEILGDLDGDPVG